MKREFISIDGLKNVLSPKEMKNVTGGSGICDNYGPNLCWVECSNGNKACASSCGYAETQCDVVSCTC